MNHSTFEMIERQLMLQTYNRLSFGAARKQQLNAL